ncbi:MAG: nucleotidyltransferase family protein [Bacteroidales bacterium]|nr:nucleotidyltransferase family protein [Bacteroidales bacterium]MDD3907471.1 nucleotidyltransferase family protein [Bacteroidales bacterium]MDD4713490.1 nucleotidyltransferase family protein [Bacteroidales bacterium]
MSDPLQDRTYLHERHRLSHQQIDRWLGENRSKEFMREKMQRMETVKHFISITDRLRENHIDFVCLKGPMLSFRIYGDASVRISHDVDILIQMVDLIPAINLMKEEGYVMPNEIDWPTDKLRQNLMIKSSQHINLLNKNLGFSVELHWTIIHSLSLTPEKVQELLKSNLTIVAFAGREFSVMNKEFELLFLMIHGARHEWNRLKWLMDINDYPLEDFDQNHFLELVNIFRAEQIIGQTNYFLKRYFNRQTPLPGGIKPAIYMIRHAQRAINGELYPASSTLMDILCIYKYRMLLFPGFSYKFKIIGEVSITQTDVTQQKFSNKLTYYLYRPYSFIKRRVLHA